MHPRYAAFGLLLLFCGPVCILAHPEIEEQITHLTKLIAEAPVASSAELYLQRGELFRIHEEWAAALSDFEEVSMLDPSLAAVHRCRGRMFYEMGKSRRALVELDVFLKEVPSDAEALIARARALSDLGDFAGAKRDYAEAIALSESPRPELYLELVEEIESRPGDSKAEALRILGEGIERLGPITALQVPAIEIERARGEYDSAIGRIDAMRANGGNQVQWLKLRGDVLIEAGLVRSARLDYMEALVEYDKLSVRQRNLRPFRNMRSEIEASLLALSGASAADVNGEGPQ